MVAQKIAPTEDVCPGKLTHQGVSQKNLVVPCSSQKPNGIRPNPKAAVSAMPVVSVTAKARITAIFMAITPLQRCLELFGAGAILRCCRLIKNGRDAKQTIAIAAKYPMRSAAPSLYDCTCHRGVGWLFNLVGSIRPVSCPQRSAALSRNYGAIRSGGRLS
jgi:hypothetical protein